MKTTSLDYLEHIEKSLDAWLPETFAPPGLLNESMRYSLFAGGKRLRPQLVMASCESLGGDPLQALSPAVAIEMIHTYSLIHDDLPAMDDDDQRRGRPTSHKAYGEDMAILTGDALLTEAFVILSDKTPEASWVPDLVSVIARRAGWSGMVGGQVADIKSAKKEGSLKLLEFIHSRKTAALISASLECGAICAQADAKDRKRYAKIGERLGLVFQIVDDILDTTQSSQTLGKTSGKDEIQEKITYPGVVGLDRSQKFVQALEAEILESLDPEGSQAEPLRQLIHKCIHRDH